MPLAFTQEDFLVLCFELIDYVPDKELKSLYCVKRNHSQRVMSSATTVQNHPSYQTTRADILILNEIIL